VAVNSEIRSGSSVGKPAESRISIFRPGTLRRFFAKLRMESSALRAAKSACAFRKFGAPLVDATSVSFPVGALDSRFELRSPLTAAFNNALSAVKFCRIVNVPPKSTTAIMRSVTSLCSMNLAAAARA
jgi:hypothetical protein